MLDPSAKLSASSCTPHAVHVHRLFLDVHEELHDVYVDVEQEGAALTVVHDALAGRGPASYGTIATAGGRLSSARVAVGHQRIFIRLRARTRALRSVLR